MNSSVHVEGEFEHHNVEAVEAAEAASAQFMPVVKIMTSGRLDPRTGCAQVAHARAHHHAQTRNIYNFLFIVGLLQKIRKDLVGERDRAVRRQ